MIADTAHSSLKLAAGYRHFQRLLDEGLRKRDPDASIPWSATEPPAWANTFRPRIIADIGSAQGVFAAAVLTRLGQWGCLGCLEKVVLIEEEPGFGTTATGRRAISADHAKVARAYGVANVEVLLLNDTAVPSRSLTEGAPVLLVGGKTLSADLIIASHVTYYFGDGGRHFLNAATATVAPTNGLVWVVARKLDCPIYRTRETCNWDQPFGHSPIDFAEPLETALRAEGRIRIIDVRDRSYLDEASRPHNCPQITQLLGWRHVEFDPNGKTARTAAALCEQLGPLFSERHLIIR